MIDYKGTQRDVTDIALFRISEFETFLTDLFIILIFSNMQTKQKSVCSVLRHTALQPSKQIFRYKHVTVKHVFCDPSIQRPPGI